MIFFPFFSLVAIENLQNQFIFRLLTLSLANIKRLLCSTYSSTFWTNKSRDKLKANEYPKRYPRWIQFPNLWANKIHITTTLPPQPLHYLLKFFVPKVATHTYWKGEKNTKIISIGTSNKDDWCAFTSAQRCPAKPPLQPLSIGYQKKEETSPTSSIIMVVLKIHTHGPQKNQWMGPMIYEHGFQIKLREWNNLSKSSILYDQNRWFFEFFK
jgi:hypothetical protein